jgi:hypothetical protein
VGNGKHLHEAHLVAYIRLIQTREYCKVLSDWIKREYPGSADKVLPELREKWKKLG